MCKLVSCIPNFSEGRDKGIVGALVDVAQNAPGAVLLDYSSDQDHNRSVLTLTGSPEGVAEAAFRLCREACRLIDMNKHEGVHPRMGAADVIPFVPVRNCTMPECVDLSKKLAGRIAGELGIPCYLYEESCTAENRRDLASVRRGGFEGMPQKLLLDGWAPDFGERQIHPTAGVTAVGARHPLIAFNVNLGTGDIRIAKKIAKAVRGSSGGLKYCKAIGVRLESRGIVQVSMNLVNYQETPVFAAFDAVCSEAGRLGVAVAGSEIIGLTPANALAGCAAHYLKLEGFDCSKQILENRIPDIY